MWHVPFLWLSILLFFCGPTWAGPEIRILDTPNRLSFSGFSSALSTLGRCEWRRNPRLYCWRVRASLGRE